MFFAYAASPQPSLGGATATNAQAASLALGNTSSGGSSGGGGALVKNGIIATPTATTTAAQQQAAMAGGWTPTAGYATTNTPAPTVTPGINAGDIASTKPLTITPQTSDSDINTYVNSLITNPTSQTPAEQQRTSLTSTLQNLINQDAQKGNRFDQLQSSYGVQNMTQQLNDLNLQIAQRKNFFTQQDQTAENKAIPTPFIVGEQSQIQRQSAIELGALSATAQALQGNIQLANDTIDRTIKMEFEPIENQIGYTKDLLDVNYQDLTRQEQKQADQTKQLLQERQGMIDDLKSAKKDAYSSVFASAATPGQKSQAAIDIANAQTTDEAYAVAAKYSAPKADTSVQDFGGNKVLIDNNTGRTIKVLGSSSTGGNGSVVVPNNVDLQGLNKPLQDAFNSVILGLPATAAKTASATFSSLVQSGDVDGAKAYIIRVALSNLPADQQTQTIGRSQAISALTDIQSLLDQAKSEGVDTGILKGNIQNAAQKLGATGNEDLAYTGSRIQQALQTYRRAMTGVAFSPAESAQYSKIFPDLTNTDKLNSTSISALLDAFDSNNRAALATYIGDNNYNQLFGKSQATLPSQRAAATSPDLSNAISTAQTHGYASKDIVSQIQTSYPDYGSKIQQALTAGYSYDDIVNFLKQPQ